MARDQKQTRYHVSPSTNRESIRRYGLDYTRMPTDAVGIANGWPGVPEEQGVFLTDGDDVREALFFVRMGSGREVDVWEVDVLGLSLEPGPDGWLLCRTLIEASRITLVEVWRTGTEPFDEGQRVFRTAD